MGRQIADSDIFGTLFDHPGYIAGRWYLPVGYQNVSGSGAAPGAGSIRILPGYIKQKITLNALGMRVTTLYSSGNVQAAIYAHNPATVKPTGTPLASTASMSTTTAVPVNAAVSIQLNPGLYWFASNCDNGTAVFASPNAGAEFGQTLLGSATQGTDLSSSSGMLGFSYAQTFGTWPDLTAATLVEVYGAASLPYVQFDVASVP